MDEYENPTDHYFQSTDFQIGNIIQYIDIIKNLNGTIAIVVEIKSREIGVLRMESERHCFNVYRTLSIPIAKNKIKIIEV